MVIDKWVCLSWYVDNDSGKFELWFGHTTRRHTRTQSHPRISQQDLPQRVKNRQVGLVRLHPQGFSPSFGCNRHNHIKPSTTRNDLHHQDIQSQSLMEWQPLMSATKFQTPKTKAKCIWTKHPIHENIPNSYNQEELTAATSKVLHLRSKYLLETSLSHEASFDEANKDISQTNVETGKRQ